MESENKILSIVEEEAQQSGLTLETRFDELALDSLEFVEVMVRVTAECGVDIPDEDWAKLETIGDLVCKVQSQLV
jgi:acyl carrier protein